MNLRTRLVGTAMRVLPGTSIASMSPGQIERARRGLPRNRLTTPIIGRPARGVTTAERVLDTAAGPVPVRCYRPAGASSRLPVVVHVHGGGWVLGSLDGGDWVCSHVAARAGVLVVSVDYGLAPEQPFPTAVEQCLAATQWVARHGHDLGGDPARLAVMGDSAGGNLAAVVAQLARDEGPSIALQVLIYPSTDATLASPSIEQHANGILLTRDDIVAFLGHYLDGHDPTDPRVSPLLAHDHAALAPALIQTAEHDPLRDDGHRYAEALRRAGVEVRYTCYLGVPHGFLSAPGLAPPAWQALDEIARELRARLR